MDSSPLHCFKASQGSRSAALANSSAKDFSSWQKQHRHVANPSWEHARTSENTAFAFLSISKRSNFETSYNMHFSCATHEHIQQPIQPVSRDVCICVWAAWPSAPQTFEVNAACTAWASYNACSAWPRRWFRVISGWRLGAFLRTHEVPRRFGSRRQRPPKPGKRHQDLKWPNAYWAYYAFGQPSMQPISRFFNFHRFFYL